MLENPNAIANKSFLQIFEFYKFEINHAKRRSPEHTVNKDLKIAIFISPSRKLQGKESSSATYQFPFFKWGEVNDIKHGKMDIYEGFMGCN